MMYYKYQYRDIPGITYYLSSPDNEIIRLGTKYLKIHITLYDNNSDTWQALKHYVLCNMSRQKITKYEYDLIKMKYL